MVRGMFDAIQDMTDIKDGKDHQLNQLRTTTHHVTENVAWQLWEEAKKTHAGRPDVLPWTTSFYRKPYDSLQERWEDLIDSMKIEPCKPQAGNTEMPPFATSFINRRYESLEARWEAMLLLMRKSKGAAVNLLVASYIKRFANDPHGEEENAKRSGANQAQAPAPAPEEKAAEAVDAQSQQELDANMGPHQRGDGAPSANNEYKPMAAPAFPDVQVGPANYANYNNDEFAEAAVQNTQRADVPPSMEQLMFQRNMWPVEQMLITSSTKNSRKPRAIGHSRPGLRQALLAGLAPHERSQHRRTTREPPPQVHSPLALSSSMTAFYAAEGALNALYHRTPVEGSTDDIPKTRHQQRPLVMQMADAL
ncbi:hypothetical protein B0T20DRAFT_477498 [Sordaria brevicollis]|uniref:Uncharacterized protein n=1 Tax=Sordaria brevicollis TaxID=83679 RepID=A0AAE0PGY4_SORBR|nr:hypothetical protein B0T20DRAFT_477498 [Sordaria brevicollis]